MENVPIKDFNNNVELTNPSYHKKVYTKKRVLKTRIVMRTRIVESEKYHSHKKTGIAKKIFFEKYFQNLIEIKSMMNRMKNIFEELCDWGTRET